MIAAYGFETILNAKESVEGNSGLLLTKLTVFLKEGPPPLIISDGRRILRREKFKLGKREQPSCGAGVARSKNDISFFDPPLAPF